MRPIIVRAPKNEHCPRKVRDSSLCYQVLHTCLFKDCVREDIFRQL